MITKAASINDHVEIVATLIEAGAADVDRVDGNGNTALAWVRSKKRRLHAHAHAHMHARAHTRAHTHAHAHPRLPPLVVLQMLNFALLVCTSASFQPIPKASFYGRAEVVTALLAARADVNTVDKKGGTALMAAAGHGHDEVVNVLLQAGAGVNAANIDGLTAVIKSGCDGHASIVHTLILAGADLTATDIDGEAAAEAALSCGYTDLATTLSIAASLPLVESMPQSAHYLAAGIPLQPSPQPSYHVHPHHLGLLLTEIGPWLQDVALPRAATVPNIKAFVFTLVSHTYTLTHTHPKLAQQFFTQFLLPAAKAEQIKMHPVLHAMAVEMEAAIPMAPASLRDKAGVTQGGSS